MTNSEITDKDREMAKACLECKVCSNARRKQWGLAFWFVKFVERGMCPNCQAYERVFGKKAHEPLANDTSRR